MNKKTLLWLLHLGMLIGMPLTDIATGNNFNELFVSVMAVTSSACCLCLFALGIVRLVKFIKNKIIRTNSVKPPVDHGPTAEYTDYEDMCNQYERLMDRKQKKRTNGNYCFFCWFWNSGRGDNIC